MRFRNLIIYLLIIAGLVYGGLKGYIFIRAKQQLDTLITAVAPFVYIQYDSIGSKLDGTVFVEKTAINPRGIDDTATIERVSIKTPGLMFLLAGDKQISQGDLPERIGLEMQGVRIQLDGAIVKKLEQVQAQRPNNQPSEGLLCTLSRDFITAQYRQLGLKELVFDSQYMIERSAAPSEVDMTLRYVLHGIERGEFKVTLAGVGTSVNSVNNKMPLLKNMKFVYRPNAEFVNQALEYCSKRQDTDVATFMEQLFNKRDADFAEELGFIPGPGIRDALKRLVQDQGELRIFAYPVSPLDVTTIHLYKPEDWPKLLGLSVYVGETQIDDISFQLLNKAGKSGATSFFEFLGLAGKTAAEKEALAKEQAALAEAQKKLKKKRKPGFRVATKQEIPQLQWKDVRIKTYEGKLREGRILSVRDGVISLEKRTRGGTFSTKVYVGAIEKIEVYE